MTIDAHVSPSQTWDWPRFMKGSLPNPLDLVAPPNNLTQSILPGWNFGVINVTRQNSRDPEAERNIVAKYSYGRQIGRVMDALAALVEKLPEHQQEKKVFKDLLEIHAEVDKIKAEAAAKRVDDLTSDLATLRDQMEPADYRRMVAKLREALKRAEERP